MIELKDRTIQGGISLLEAFKKMDAIDRKLLLVLEGDLFVGLLSAGDIQRSIIQGIPLSVVVRSVLRQDVKIARPDDSFEAVRQLMIEYRMEFCPVVSVDNKILQVFFWEDVFSEKEIGPKKSFNLPIVIMAGGAGTRLKPITNVLPKPLIPIGEISILEHIFNRFSEYGCNHFFLSLNYKADLIEYYVKTLDLDFKVDFFREIKPCGTAGSLTLLRGIVKEAFFVSNCDILIDQDYSEILDYHQNNNNEITIVAALKHYPIPYGTIETTENGRLVRLTEKPEITFKINSGMYLLEPHLLDEIPEGEFYHITHLIDHVINRGGRVGVFPVSEKSWKDIGEWSEYLKNSLDDND